MLRYLFPICVTLGIASSQDVAVSPSDGPGVAREKVAQWVSAKKAASQEEAQWNQEKQMLTDLIALRDRESEQMAEVIELAQERVADIEKKSADLKGEEQKRQAWRGQFEKRVTSLEDSLIAQLPYLPEPVKNKVYDAIERLEDREDGGDLQGRFRDVLAILNEVIAFNSQIHTLPEIHEIDGQKLEVDVMYLGMKQAWYVDKTNRKAAIGLPGKNGWVWKEDPAIAGKVRSAIDIQMKKEAPAFVKLPLTGNGGGK
ncbi:MAG: DUF3450 family protein [Verrucomicrobiales bacterium]|nr:DUF3450 family protein [Verrucomicrobiales bacterium]